MFFLVGSIYLYDTALARTFAGWEYVSRGFCTTSHSGDDGVYTIYDIVICLVCVQ